MAARAERTLVTSPFASEIMHSWRADMRKFDPVIVINEFASAKRGLASMMIGHVCNSNKTRVNRLLKITLSRDAVNAKNEDWALTLDVGSNLHSNMSPFKGPQAKSTLSSISSCMRVKLFKRNSLEGRTLTTEERSEHP
jgi:hypothetical protein